MAPLTGDYGLFYIHASAGHWAPESFYRTNVIKAGAACVWLTFCSLGAKLYILRTTKARTVPPKCLHKQFLWASRSIGGWYEMHLGMSSSANRLTVTVANVYSELTVYTELQCRVLRPDEMVGMN